MPAIEGVPQRGEIWKLHQMDGNIWLFRGHGDTTEFLTKHDGAYCYRSNGNPIFNEYVSHRTGNHIGNNEDIMLLKKANSNERVIFERKMRI